MTALHGVLGALLHIQSAVSLPMGVLSVFGKISLPTEEKQDFIFGQGALRQLRLYTARADLTACEVVSVYNALIYLGKGVPFERVKREYFRRGALTLFFLGHFGGNPYSIGRVLKGMGLEYERVKPDDMGRDGAYIVSFWNGRNDPSLHTVFCVREQGKLKGYNIYANDTRPRPFDIEKYRGLFISGYYLGEK